MDTAYNFSLNIRYTPSRRMGKTGSTGTTYTSKRQKQRSIGAEERATRADATKSRISCYCNCNGNNGLAGSNVGADGDNGEHDNNRDYGPSRYEYNTSFSEANKFGHPTRNFAIGS